MTYLRAGTAALIRKLRKEKKISQTTLCHALHYNIDTIVNWERGYTTPSVKSLCEVAAYFGVPVDSFIDTAQLGQKDEEFLKSWKAPEKADATATLSHDETELLALWRHAPWKQKKEAITILKTKHD